MKAAVFIERDGVLNEVRVERQHAVSPLTLEDFRVNREAVPLLQKLKADGLLLFVTTNQPGLSRGYQSRRELDRMHELLRATFALDDILVCPHDETDGCSCRRPKPGLLVEAGFKWRLSLDHCFVISDKWQDAEAAHQVRGDRHVRPRDERRGDAHGARRGARPAGQRQRHQQRRQDRRRLG